MRHLFITAILVFYCNFLFSQNHIDLNSLPDVEDYIVVRTNPLADTVIIALHGGPTEKLYPGSFNFFEAISTFSVVEMEQYQHQNPQILSDSTMTLNEGIVYGDTCVALLEKVVNYFNNLNKTVVVMGHSFGAFILGEYIDDYGNEDVHKVIPMGGRLNMNDVMWNAYADGYGGGFSSDGLTPIIPSSLEDPQAWATFKLMSGYGYNRWVDSLASSNLANLMYVYGEYDDVVGRLLNNELNLLSNTGASVLMVPQGNHDSMFATQYMNQVLDFIRESNISSIEETILAEAEFNIYPTIFSNSLTIESKKRGVLTITDYSGQKVLQKSLQDGIQYVEFQSLASGFYIASFVTIDNEINSQKLIVK